MRDLYIYFNTCSVINDDLFFVVHNDDFRCFMQVSINDQQKQIVYPKLQRNFEINRVASSMLHIGTSVYWIDSTYRYLVEYNKSNNSVYYYKLPRIIIKEYEGITDIYYYSGKIYVIPLYSNEWIVFDIVNKRIETRIIASLNIELFMDYKCTVQDGEKIYLAGFSNREIIIINLSDLIIDGKIELPFGMLAKDIKCLPGNIYMLSVDGKLYEINGINSPEVINETGEDCFKIELIDNKKIVLLPAFGNEINTIELSTGACGRIEYPIDFEFVQSDVSKFYKYSSNERYGCFGNRRANYTLIYDKKIREFEWLPLKITQREIDMFMEQKNSVYYEGAVTIGDFIDVI